MSDIINGGGHSNGWMKWLQDLAKFCVSVLAIGALAYILFGIRFVTKDEYAVHLDWSQRKSANIDAIDSTMLQTNRAILKNLEDLSVGINQLNARLIRVEVKIEKL